MGKKERLQRRVNRIDARFKDKVKKGKKGTDMDIATHEARIQRLADKGGFAAPFMAKSPLKEIGEIHVGDPNYKGLKDIGKDWVEANKDTAISAENKINSGDEKAIDETINTKVTLSEGGKGKTSTGVPISVPSFTTTEYDLAMQSDKGKYTAPFTAKSPLKVDPFAKPKEDPNPPQYHAQKIRSKIAMMPSSAGKPVVNAIKKGVKSVVDFYSGAKKQLNWPKK